MSLAYFKRFRMEISLYDPPAAPRLPDGYFWVPWDESLVEHHAEVKFHSFHEEIDATVAEPQTARLMDIAKGVPLLRIRQVIYSTNGKATMYMLGLYRSDRHTLLIRRYR